MNTNEADSWLNGGVSGREMILDAALARGDYDEHAVIPPEVLVQVAQYDAAMTARAALVMEWAESRRAILHGTPKRRFGYVAATAETLAEHWRGVAERLEGELDASRRASGALSRTLGEVRRERDVWSERAETHEQERDQALAQRDEARDLYEGADAQRLITQGALHRAKAILAGCEEARLMGERALADAQVRLESPPRVQLKDRLRIVIGETQDGRVEPGDLAYVDTLVVVKGFEQNIEAGWMRIDVQPVMEGGRI